MAVLFFSIEHDNSVNSMVAVDCMVGFLCCYDHRNYVWCIHYNLNNLAVPNSQLVYFLNNNGDFSRLLHK